MRSGWYIKRARRVRVCWMRIEWSFEGLRYGERTPGSSPLTHTGSDRGGMGGWSSRWVDVRHADGPGARQHHVGGGVDCGGSTALHAPPGRGPTGGQMCNAAEHSAAACWLPRGDGGRMRRKTLGLGLRSGGGLRALERMHGAITHRRRTAARSISAGVERAPAGQTPSDRGLADARGRCGCRRRLIP